MPLAEYLIGEPTFPDLVFDLTVLLRPVRFHERFTEHARLTVLIKRGEHRTIRQIELLSVVAAVEELAINIGASFCRQVAALCCKCPVVHCVCHDRSSP